MRTLRLLRGKRAELSGKYVLEGWLAPFTLSLMTPLKVDASVPGKISLSGTPEAPLRGVSILYDAALFKTASEEIPVSDARLQSVWGGRVARILLVSKSRSLTGEYRLSVESSP